ncbi:MAG: hypothetical protein E6R07_04705 [Nevskiaceae bacterium]|nr:MAG: hypothetical protein E6R07_04705 [Nevskiaceae bacterium]
MIRFPRRPLIISLTLSASPLAQAQAPADPTPRLTQAQIEQCLLDRRDVVARNQELTARKTALDQRSNDLLATESRLNESHEWLNGQHRELQVQSDELQRRKDDMAAYLNQASVVKQLNDAYQAHVARYNADVRAHKALVDRYNAEAATLNADLAQLDEKARATDRRCVKTPVKRADLEAAKQAVGEPPTTVLKPSTRVLP